MMKKTKIANNTTQLINQAWAFDGDRVLTGEALILAVLLHTHGDDRNSDDFKTVQKLMNDINYNE